MSLEPGLLRRFPVLAALDCLHQVAETAIVALCVAHPSIESAPLDDPHDRLADKLVDHLMRTLDAVHRYRALLDDRDRLERGLLHQPEGIDDLPF